MVSADVELAERIVSGDPNAFDTLYGRYKGDIQYHINGIVKDVFEAEDLTQEVFLRAYKAMSTYTGDASLRRWLRKIATNLCIDRMRKRRIPEVPWPTVKDRNGDEELLEVSDDEPSCLDKVQMRESEEIILRMVSCLPGYYRDVVVLHDLMHYSGDEIALELKCPLGTVKSRLSRAHAILGRFIKNEANAVYGDKKALHLSNGKSSSGNILYREMVAV